MHLFLARTLLWTGRVLFVAIALWWPPLWRDPIYTPRQARLTGQELRLPNGSTPKTDEERALAIFWAWEHRTLVKTRWVVGPYRGLRNPAGWTQTLLALATVWVVFGGVLSRWTSPAPVSPDGRQGGRRFLALLTVPLWQLRGNGARGKRAKGEADR
jgi:hypothetical protein